MSRCAVSNRGDAPAKSAGGRLSKRQKRLLCWLDAEERRTDQGFEKPPPKTRADSTQCQRQYQPQLAASRSPQLGGNRSLAGGAKRKMSGASRKDARRPLKLQEVMIKE